MDEIVCSKSGKVICKPKFGPSGYFSRYLTEFEEGDVIGAGGFGCVFSCKNILDGQVYAIKKISLDDMDVDFDHVVREVKAMAAMNHPHIVRYYSAWIEKEIVGDYKEPGERKGEYENADAEGSFLFIQQEKCGRSLEEVLAEEVLEALPILKVFKGIVLALQHIHLNGVRHGDVSPGNIFFDKDNNAKIGDFGLASLVGEGHFLANSPRALSCYAAPELKQGYYTQASDFYSLGFILLEMVEGYRSQMEKAKAFEYFIAKRRVRKFAGLPQLTELQSAVESSILFPTDEAYNARPAITEIMEMDYWNSEELYM